MEVYRMVNTHARRSIKWCLYRSDHCPITWVTGGAAAPHQSLAFGGQLCRDADRRDLKTRPGRPAQEE